MSLVKRNIFHICDAQTHLDHRVTVFTFAKRIRKKKRDSQEQKALLIRHKQKAKVKQ